MQRRGEAVQGRVDGVAPTTSVIVNPNDAVYDGTMIRVVLDTDVLLSAFLSSAGASRQLLLDALDGKFSLLLSTPLLLEYEAVLRRPPHLERARATDAEVMEILDALAGICVPVVFDYNWRPTGAHADDELVVETAINGHADALATFNLKDMKAAGALFGFRAQRPGPLLRSMRT
jgi:putative PIN family toxin of toxin-antitoxin system